MIAAMVVVMDVIHQAFKEITCTGGADACRLHEETHTSNKYRYSKLDLCTSCRIVLICE